jgi:enoyl-CoA hydratase
VSDVLIRVEGGVGRITLNRPARLNALTLEMVERIRVALDQWEADSGVAFVLIDGAGERGLCAGGDIRAVYDATLAAQLSANENFFRNEYQLNARIAEFAKPYVALMDGIVMGGGIGLSAHGSHRVVTERSRAAMPETGIGFFPDIGATWLLSRALREFGTHVALTGDAIGAADAMICGLADVYVPSARLPTLLEALRSCGAAELDGCIRGHSETPPSGVFEEGRVWIETCYAGDNVEAIIAALAARGESAARQAATTIAQRSPSSLKITLHALRTAPALGGLRPCLEREFGMALVRTGGHDFVEGVRAAIVDKDRKPRWVPASLDEMSDRDVTQFFASAALKPRLWLDEASR